MRSGALQVKVHCMPLDMTDFDAVEKAYENIPDEFKPVHILLNNAGLASSMAPGHKQEMASVVVISKCAS